MFKMQCIKIMSHKSNVRAVSTNPEPHTENTDRVSLCVYAGIKIISLLQIKSLCQIEDMI